LLAIIAIQFPKSTTQKNDERENLRRKTVEKKQEKVRKSCSAELIGGVVAPCRKVGSTKASEELRYVEEINRVKKNTAVFRSITWAV
jgi:hypothetical protein